MIRDESMSENSNACNVFSRMMSKASKKKKKNVKSSSSDKVEKKKSNVEAKKKIRVRIAKTASSKKVLSVAKQPVIAIVQESKRMPKRKNRTSAPLPHPLLLQNPRKEQTVEKKKNKKTLKKRTAAEAATTTNEKKKKKLKGNSDEWILKQNPFFLSAEQRERKKEILMRRKEEKKQSAVKRLREKEKETQKHDQVLKQTFGRADNPFFANVGSAIRRQAKRQKMKASIVDLSGESDADSKRKWRLSLFPEDSSLIQLPPRLSPSSKVSFVFAEKTNPPISTQLTVSDAIRKILCPNKNSDAVSKPHDSMPFKSSSISAILSEIKSTFFEHDKEDTDLDMEIETLISTLNHNAKRLYANSKHEHAIWTRKYAPEKPSELLGSVTNRITNQMSEWLELWQKRFTEERRLERKRLKNRLRQSFFLDRDSEACVATTLYISTSRYIHTHTHTHDHFRYMEAACNKRVSTGFLLEGPIGSGKSIAVHACAKAANAKVIEIHSGSRRSRRDILQMIGEATQSKRLAMSGESGASSSSNKNVMTKKKKKRIDDDEDDENEKEKEVDSEKEAQMTIILFEDVDVVLETDKGFLGAIRKVLENAKCPVVLTCSKLPHQLRQIAREDPRSLKTRHVQRPTRWKSALWLKAICEVESLSVTISQLDRVLLHHDFNIAKCLHCLQWMKERVTLFESRRDLELSFLPSSVSCDEGDVKTIVARRRCCPEVVAIEPESGPLEGGTHVEISLRLVDASVKDQMYLTSSPIRILIANEECTSVEIAEWDWDAKPEPSLTLRAVTPECLVSKSRANWPQNVVVLFAFGRCRTDETVRHNAMFTFEEEVDESNVTEEIDTSLVDIMSQQEENNDDVAAVHSASSEEMLVESGQEESKVDDDAVVKSVSPEKTVTESTAKPEEKISKDLITTSTTPSTEKFQISPEMIENTVKPLFDLAKNCDLMCHADIIKMNGFQFEERHQFEAQDTAHAELCRSRGQQICESLTKLNLRGEDRDFTLRTSQESQWSRYDRILGHAKGGIRDYPCHDLLKSLRVRSNVSTDVMPSLRLICILQNEKMRLEALKGQDMSSGRRRLRRRRNAGPVHYLDLPNVCVYLTDSQKKWLASKSAPTFIL